MDKIGKKQILEAYDKLNIKPCFNQLFKYKNKKISEACPLGALYLVEIANFYHYENNIKEMRSVEQLQKTWKYIKYKYNTEFFWGFIDGFDRKYPLPYKDEDIYRSAYKQGENIREVLVERYDLDDRELLWESLYESGLSQ